MDYRVCIKNTGTSECVMTDWFPNDGGWSDALQFEWTENGHSCDCILGELFHAAKGEPDPDYPCDGEIFTPLYAEFRDGKIVPISVWFTPTRTLMGASAAQISGDIRVSLMTTPKTERE